MLHMLIIDESKKSYEAIESMFSADFEVRSIPGTALETMDAETEPNVVLYVGVGPATEIRKKVALVRRTWPSTLVFLLLPTFKGEAQFDNVFIPAHRILFGPSSRKELTRTVNEFSGILNQAARSGKERAVLHALIEFTSNYIPCVYLCYQKALPLLLSLAAHVGEDQNRLRECVTAYLLILASLDGEMLSSVMSGYDRSAETMRTISEHLEGAVHLLATDERTEEMAHNLRYALKGFDGSGFPKDDVRGERIPLPSRMIRLVMDYHYLLQNGKGTGEAIFILNQRAKFYDKDLLKVLQAIVGDTGRVVQRAVYPLGLIPGMIVAEDVFGTVDGQQRKFLSSGEVLTPKTIEFIQRHCDEFLDITEPIQIREEVAPESEA